MFICPETCHCDVEDQSSAVVRDSDLRATSPCRIPGVWLCMPYGTVWHNATVWPVTPVKASAHTRRAVKSPLRGDGEADAPFLSLAKPKSLGEVLFHQGLHCKATPAYLQIM